MTAHRSGCLCPPCHAARRIALRAAIAASGRLPTSYELALLAAPRVER